MSKYRLVPLTLLALLMAGCGGNTIPDPDPSATAAGGDDAGADTGGFDDADWMGGEEIPEEDPSAGELTNVILFDFDSAEVRADFTDIVARHALMLSNDSTKRVRLEGHADERGSREYNIGLGERRSQAVRRMLMIQGASAAQISTVSFGEERPVAFGSDEDSWAQNRRVEIKYTN